MSFYTDDPFASAGGQATPAGGQVAPAGGQYAITMAEKTSRSKWNSGIAIFHILFF